MVFGYHDVIDISILYLIIAIRNEIRRLSRRKESPNGLLIIVTYEGLRNMRKAMMNVEWDGICVDEGQKLRNSSAEITAVCKLLCGYHRILLSGTPIQNSLLELWSLFDFCYPGKYVIIRTIYDV